MQNIEIEPFQPPALSLLDYYGSEAVNQTQKIENKNGTMDGDDGQPPRDTADGRDSSPHKTGHNEPSMNPGFCQLKPPQSEKMYSIRSPLSNTQDMRDGSTQEVAKTAPKSRRIRKPRGQRNQKTPRGIKGYRTKNFLPHFKGTHFNHLIKYYGEEYVYSFPFLSHIKQKDGITLSDYEEIYRCEALADGLRDMFRSQVLYREMMISRCYHGSRLAHQKKLHLFERAFESKVFEKIN